MIGVCIKSTSLLLLALLMQARVVAETQPLEFRRGVSQIHEYELKYAGDFPHFDYLNTDAPKGGTLVLPWLKPLNTVSPMYQPAGFSRSYDHLIERAGDEPSGYYGSLVRLKHSLNNFCLQADFRAKYSTYKQLCNWLES